MQDTGKERKSCLGCSIIAVCGWLVCAAMCLWLTISLEGYPRAYSLAYPAAMAVLFSNIFVFIFTSSRCAGDVRRLLPAVSASGRGPCCCWSGSGAGTGWPPEDVPRRGRPAAPPAHPLGKNTGPAPDLIFYLRGKRV